MNLIIYFFKTPSKKLSKVFSFFFHFLPVFFSASLPETVLALENQKEEKISQLLLKTHLVKSRGSRKLWDLKADKIFQEKGSDRWSLDQIIFHFFGKNGESYKITGLSGFLDKPQRKLKIKGNVKVTSSRGFILTCSEILYEEQKEQITGLKPIEMRTFSENPENKEKIFLIKGDSFKIDLKTNTVELNNNIHGEKMLSEGRLMTIKSESIEFDTDSNDVFFNKSVVVSVKPFEITGPQAKIKYKNDKLQSLFMDKDVTIKDQRRFGKAREIEIFFTKNQFILRGNPKVVQGEDRVIGSEIVILDGGNRVRVKKAKARYNTKKKEKTNF